VIDIAFRPGFGLRSHPGRVRPENEDVIVVDIACGFALVNDGMGGEVSGEVAARTAAAAMASSFCSRPRTLSLADVVRDAFIAADQSLGALVASNPSLSGMGSAVVAVAFDGRIAQVSHVGDARAYLLRRQTGSLSPAPPAPVYSPPERLPSGALLTCLTRDHTSVCELVERQHLTRDDGRHHPLRSRLTRVLGRPDATPDALALELEPGDRVLLCSDGLWEMVEDPAIGRALDEAATAQAAADQLVEEALVAGGRDNVSVVVLSWEQAA
jgi:protein phosphatase